MRKVNASAVTGVEGVVAESSELAYADTLLLMTDEAFAIEKAQLTATLNAAELARIIVANPHAFIVARGDRARWNVMNFFAKARTEGRRK